MRARFLFLYDIACPKRLRRVANLLEGYGTRVQKSVFECELAPRERARLEAQTRALLDERCDDVRIYRLCPRFVQTRVAFGDGEIPQARPFLMG